MDNGKNLAKSMDVTAKVAQLYQNRVRKAVEHYDERVKNVRDDYMLGVAAVTSPLDVMRDWSSYAIDSMQRGILFLDAMRQRGNQYLEHTRAGLPPVLNFDYEMVLDGRTLERAVNYALVKIVPPAGVTVDPRRRPYVIIDPRAGHGPGIGGFEGDSQVGVVLREGHPVSFVICCREPEPGQTLLDVCEAASIIAAHPPWQLPTIAGFGLFGCSSRTRSTKRRSAAQTSSSVWPGSGSRKKMTK